METTSDGATASRTRQAGSSERHANVLATPQLPAHPFPPQHYIPTLLATKGLDAESFCHIDGVAATDWSAGGPHPKNYKWAGGAAAQARTMRTVPCPHLLHPFCAGRGRFSRG